MSSSIVSRRYVPSISDMVWSATSSMKVSGTLVTGMPRSVAASTSTWSVPTLPKAITLQFSRPSMTARLIGTPLPPMMASAWRAASRNSSSVVAVTCTISAPMGLSASISYSKVVGLPVLPVTTVNSGTGSSVPAVAKVA